MNPFLYLSVMLSTILFAGIITFVPMLKKLRQDYRDSLKLDVSVEQMISLEKRITTFYEKHKLKPGASIYEISKILNVCEGGDSDGIQDQAFIEEINESGNMRVTFKEGLTEAQHNFNFAHECAHVINDDPVPATRPDQKNKPEIEQLADYTAAALLMPIEDVYKFLVSKDYKKATRFKRVSIVTALCRTYRVSEIIAIRRINEIYAIKSHR